MKRLSVLFSLVLSGTLFYSQLLLASDDLQSLFDLDITELGSVELTVASLEPEIIINTPAVVSSYKVRDLSRMGLRTLKDVLSFMPGFNLQDASLGGATVMIRGVAETFNQKVLFLVDDVPYWMPSHGAIPLLGIPISAIDSVEVIRGPGAVIYGTNASTGVIKVVTKKSASNQVALNAGANGRTNGNVHYHHDFDEQSSINVSFETQNDDGFNGRHIDTPIPPDFWSDTTVPPTEGEIKKPEDFSSMLINYRRDQTYIGIQSYSASVNGLAGFSSLANQSSLEEKGYLLALSDGWNLGDSHLKLYSDYNEHHLEIPLQNHPREGGDARFAFDNDGKDNYRWRLGSNINHGISENISIFAGLETEKRSTGNYQIIDADNFVLTTMIPKSTTREDSAFLQLDWTPGIWRFLVGARYIDNERSGSNTSPRLSAVRQLDQHRSIKFLYSEGFNSPNFAQQLISIPGAIIGDDELQAEVIKSTDIAYSDVDENSLFVVNIYYYSADNFITRLALDGGGNQFTNSNDFHRYGLELDYQIRHQLWQAYGNFSWNHQGDRAINNDITALFSPRLNLNLGLVYQLNSIQRGADNASHRQLIGGNIRYQGARNEADELVFIDLNYEYLIASHKLILTLKNSLDEEVLYPDIQNYHANFLVPGGDGRRLELGYQYNF